jgi:hypothetical protein
MFHLLSKSTITLLFISLAILVLSILLFNKHKNEAFAIINDDDDEDLLANLRPEDIIENTQLSDKELAQRQADYYQSRFVSELNPELIDDEEVEEEVPKLQMCNGRCDCCYKNQSSEDRITGCKKMYGKQPAKLQECLTRNSKYAFEACKDLYGTGGIFGFGKKCN